MTKVTYIGLKNLVMTKKKGKRPLFSTSVPILGFRLKLKMKTKKVFTFNPLSAHDVYIHHSQALSQCV